MKVSPNSVLNESNYLTEPTKRCRVMGKKCVVWSQTVYHLWNWISQIDTNVLVTALALFHASPTARQRGFHAETGPLRAGAHVPGTCLLQGGCGTQLQICLSACAPLTMKHCLSAVSLDKVNVLLNNALPCYSALRFMKCFHLCIIWFTEQLWGKYNDPCFTRQKTEAL